MRIIVWILLTSLLSLIGCAPSKTSQFYLLNPLPPVKTNPLYNKVRIGINSVTVPAYLEKPQLVIYNSANQVSVNEYHQWAEPLDKTIKRIIKSNLDMLLPGAIIEYLPGDLQFKPDYYLQINISEFLMKTNGDVRLRAEYVIFDDTHALKKQNIYYHLAIKEPVIGNFVVQMNQLLNNFTQDVSRGFKTLLRVK